MKRKLVGLLVTLAVAVGGLGVSSTPASASLPRCTGSSWREISPNALVRQPSPHSCILRRGDHDNLGVYALQLTLNNCYRQHIAIDLDFGPATERALRNAQAWERATSSPHLVVDGIYGPATRTAMHWLVLEKGGQVCSQIERIF